MRWVKDGPDIPVEIVQAVEDGRLAFFCGAGISRRAGLPDFQGLVEAVYRKLHRDRLSHPPEQVAFERGDYDQVFAALEIAIKEPGAIREHVAKALELAEDADTNTHQALLKLATERSGKCHLVTTNYDCCFSKHVQQRIRLDAAPRLPVPRPLRWGSVVHLHGFLDDCGANREGLVLSSADFGAAYLVDGWATRFLRELFQNFVVLFVGYAADDLVVKYMLQALAVGLAERGEKPNAFALAGIESDERSTATAWEAKGIRPILYRTDDSHRVVHQTLRAWAENSSLGLLGRRSIVSERLNQPAPADRDEVIDQVVWALRDDNGATSEFIAESEPSPPPQHWLRILDDNNLLSLGNVPLVGTVGRIDSFQPLHQVTWNLARWVSRHIGEPSVLDWALSKGGSLHANFRWLIRDQLNRQGATIRPEVRKAWSYLARHRPDVAIGGFGDLYSLVERVESGAWDLGVKGEVVAAIQPRFVLQRDRLWDIVRKAGGSAADKYPLKLEVSFAGGDETEYLIGSIRAKADSDALLTALLDDCTAYLRQAMEVFEAFDLASPEGDETWIWLKSINAPDDGLARRAMVTLITLAAACMDSASRVNPQLARTQTDYWKTVNYPIFQRLVCFALARPNLFTPSEALAYALGSDLVLWHYSCRNEINALLPHIWLGIGQEESRSLIARILEGPPAEFYRSDLSPDQLEAALQEEIAERLSVLERTDRPLPADGAAVLDAAKKRAQDRFSTEPPAKQESLVDLDAPAIADKLQHGFPQKSLYYEQWAEVVSNDWNRAVDVLKRLAALNRWPSDVWAAVLNHSVVLLINGPNGERVLQILALLTKAPGTLIEQTLPHLVQVVQFLPRLKGNLNEESYWALWDKAFAAATSESATDPTSVESLEAAHDSELGRLTGALFEWVGVHADEDASEGVWKRIDFACGTASGRGGAARGVAAMRLAWLFSRRPDWTRSTLLPSFNWKCPAEATVVWQGFSCRAEFTPALWLALKGDFIATFENIAKLDDAAVRVLYQAVGRIAVHEPSWLASDESQRIVTQAASIGRHQIAWIFWRNLDAAGDKAASLWRERIGPWIEACWQLDESLKDKETAEMLIHVALSAGEAFPDAVDLIVPRLPTLDRVESAIFLLGRSQAPDQHPQAVLKLLDRVTNRSQRFFKRDMVNLLRRVALVWPEAERDPRFRDLSDFAAA